MATVGHEDPCKSDRFKKLCALAQSGTLVGEDLAELKKHLLSCGRCREIFEQYQSLIVVRLPMLAASYTNLREDAAADLSTARERLFARIQ